MLRKKFTQLKQENSTQYLDKQRIKPTRIDYDSYDNKFAT